jgi:hypothetical protein
MEERWNFFPGILSFFVTILAKSLIISFQYNIESACFFYSNPVSMYVQSSATEIQTPTHRNLIGRRMTVPSPVLSPSSILPPTVVLLCSHSRKQKFLFAFPKSYYIDYFHFFNYRSMKLRKLGSVCVDINPRMTEYLSHYTDQITDWQTVEPAFNSGARSEVFLNFTASRPAQGAHSSSCDSLLRR